MAGRKVAPRATPPVDLPAGFYHSKVADYPVETRKLLVVPPGLHFIIPGDFEQGAIVWIEPGTEEPALVAEYAKKLEEEGAVRVLVDPVDRGEAAVAERAVETVAATGVRQVVVELANKSREDVRPLVLEILEKALSEVGL